MTRREAAKEAVKRAFADLVERVREARLNEIAMDVRAAERRLQEAETEYQAAIDAENNQAGAA